MIENVTPSMGCGLQNSMQNVVRLTAGLGPLIENGFY